jgi:hypothetical protein
VVGGDMVTGGSPLDPVFWAHHCMVDYCWAKWNIELENNNTNDQAWLDYLRRDPLSELAPSRAAFLA